MHIIKIKKSIIVLFQDAIKVSVAVSTLEEVPAVPETVPNPFNAGISEIACEILAYRAFLCVFQVRSLILPVKLGNVIAATTPIMVRESKISAMVKPCRSVDVNADFFILPPFILQKISIPDLYFSKYDL